MEAALNALMAPNKTAQTGAKSLAGDLFSIDSGKLPVVKEDNGFSGMLKEKMGQSSSTAQDRERNELPAGGKDESHVQERRSEQTQEGKDSHRSADREDASGKREEKGEADQQEKEASAEQEAEEQAHAEEAVAEGETATPESLLQMDEVVEVDLEEAVETFQQPLQQVQLEGAEIMGPQVAAAQQVSEGALEGEEGALREELLRGRKLQADERSVNSKLPPELQQNRESIQVSDQGQAFKEMMSALKGRQAGEELLQGGEMRDQSGPQNGTSGFNLMSGMTPLSSAERPAELKGMSVPPQSRQWSSELGEKVLFMAGKKIQSAEIRLNPPNLGLMEVKLAINGDQAQLVFQSGNAMVRDVLESSIPRIREMLEQNGITLTDVNVGDRQQQSEQQAEGEKGQSGQGGSLLGNGGELEEDEVVSISTMAVDRIGLVDYYI